MLTEKFTKENENVEFEVHLFQNTLIDNIL